MATETGKTKFGGHFVTLTDAENQSYKLWEVRSGIILHTGKDRSVPLSQEQAKELIEELQIYVETGELRRPEPEPKFDYDQLSPNIRKLVKLLHSWGYETIDSGDGTNAEEGMECAVPEPMVVIQIESGDLVEEAGVLWDRLCGIGAKMGENHRRVNASYSREDGIRLLLVLNVTDGDLD